MVDEYCSPGTGEARLNQVCADESHWNASKTSGPSYSHSQRPWALPTKTRQENTTQGILLCTAQICRITNTLTHTHSELRIPRSAALYLMPRCHKDTNQTTTPLKRDPPLNPRLLTHTLLIINTGHKISFVSFHLLFTLPSRCESQESQQSLIH